MKKFKQLLLVLMVCSIYTYNSNALISVGYRYGTIGHGLELKTMLYEGIYIRGAYIQSENNKTINQVQDFLNNYAPKNLANNINSYLDAIPDINSKAISLILDYHPFSSSGFQISAGLLKFLEGSTFVVKTKDVNNKIVRTNKNFPQLAPALTVGYDAALVGTDFINFSIEYGKVFAVDKFSDMITLFSVGIKLSI